MPNLDDIIWAAITFRDFNYNFAYLKILREVSFLETLRISPIDLEVDEVRHILVQFLNDWGCMIRNYDDVTASKLKNCIVATHSELISIQEHSILGFNFEDQGTSEKIPEIFSKFWTFSAGSEIAKNFGSTATSKTLHIINPNLFTMWDDEIRYQYGFIIGYGSEYLQFLKEIKKIAEKLVSECRQRFNVAEPALWLSERLNINPPHSLTKFIDEFNWLKYKRALLRPPDWVCPL